MLKAIFNWFNKKPDPRAEAPAVQPEAAPYKVEPPVAPVQPTLVVDGHGDVQEVKEAKPKRKPAAKKPAAMKATKKPAAKKSK